MFSVFPSADASSSSSSSSLSSPVPGIPEFRDPLIVPAGEPSVSVASIANLMQMQASSASGSSLPVVDLTNTTAAVAPSGEPTSPFHFNRKVATVQALWDELQRHNRHKEKDPFLGYDTSIAEQIRLYYTERHYFNKKKPLLDEINTLMSLYSYSIEEALLEAANDMYESRVGCGQASLTTYVDSLKEPREQREANNAN
ncbi:hypothetical protein BGX24_007806, partial [Mortierella sp. AD032]